MGRKKISNISQISKITQTSILSNEYSIKTTKTFGHKKDNVALISLGLAAILALYLNPLSFWLCVATVPVIICYFLVKKIFSVPQLVLSLAWGFAVLISWSAAVDELELATGLLWVQSYFGRWDLIQFMR